MTHLNLEKLTQFRFSDFVVDVMFDRENGWVAFYTSGRPIFTMSTDALADVAVGCAQIVLHGLTSLIFMQMGTAEDNLPTREVN